MGTPDGDQQSRGAGDRKKWIVVVAILVGSIAVVTAAVIAVRTHLVSSPSGASNHVSDSNSVDDWYPTALERYQEIEVARNLLSDTLTAHDFVMRHLSHTLTDQDIEGVNTACQELKDAGQRLGATLPSPDPVLTSKVQAGVDGINAASNSCLSLDLRSGDPADIAPLRLQLRQAMAELESAYQIARGTPRG
jgi:hypothetical protein